MGVTLPVVPGDDGDGLFGVGGELELEEKEGRLTAPSSCSCNNGPLAEADFAKVEGESIEDVYRERNVRVCAWQGVVCGKLGDRSAVFEKVIPCHQSAIRGERLVTVAQVKLPACMQKFEIQFSFTHWVTPNSLVFVFKRRYNKPLRLSSSISTAD